MATKQGIFSDTLWFSWTRKSSDRYHQMMLKYVISLKCVTVITTCEKISNIKGVKGNVQPYVKGVIESPASLQGTFFLTTAQSFGINFYFILGGLIFIFFIVNDITCGATALEKVLRFLP